MAAAVSLLRAEIPLSDYEGKVPVKIPFASIKRAGRAASKVRATSSSTCKNYFVRSGSTLLRHQLRSRNLTNGSIHIHEMH